MTNIESTVTDVFCVCVVLHPCNHCKNPRLIQRRNLVSKIFADSLIIYTLKVLLKVNESYNPQNS